MTLDLINNVSFIFLFASLIVRQRYVLHILSAISGALGISFMYLKGIESSVAWLSVLFITNIVQFVRYVIANTEVSLAEADKYIIAKAFPSIRSRAFRALMKAAKIEDHAAGSSVLQRGDRTHGLTLVSKGRVRELRSNGHEMLLDAGRFWGEATLASDTDYGGSPVALKVAEGGCTTYSWTYQDLKKLFDGDAELKGAVMSGVASGIVRKAQLLLPDGELEKHTVEVSLTPELRRIHAQSAPSMTTLEISRWIAHADPLTLESGTLLKTTADLYIVVSGEVSAVRADGHSLTLGMGSFVGEVGLCKILVEERVPVEITATKKSFLYHWPYARIDQLQTEDPPLYGSVMKAVARDLATKLVRPLTPPKGMDENERLAAATCAAIGKNGGEGHTKVVAVADLVNYGINALPPTETLRAGF